MFSPGLSAEPAFASRSFPLPLGSFSFLAVGLLSVFLSDPIGVTTFRMREIRSGWVPSLRRELWCSRRGRKESPDQLRSNIVVPTEFRRSCGDDACEDSLYVHPSDLRLALVPSLGSESSWTLPAASHKSVASLACAGGDRIEHYPESISNCSSQATSCRTLPHHTLRHV